MAVIIETENKDNENKQEQNDNNNGNIELQKIISQKLQKQIISYSVLHKPVIGWGVLCLIIIIFKNVILLEFVQDY